MSKLAKKPLIIPKGVEIKFEKGKITVKGPKGTLDFEVKKSIGLKIEEGKCLVEKKDASSAFHGLYWALIKNSIQGVSEGFEKKLQLIGVGYRAAVKGNDLDVQVGYSHPTVVKIPQDLQVKVNNATQIVVCGIDKQKVGLFAARIKAIRPPEPYKGKGIRYEGEYVRKKAGKAKGKGAA